MGKYFWKFSSIGAKAIVLYVLQIKMDHGRQTFVYIFAVTFSEHLVIMRNSPVTSVGLSHFRKTAFSSFIPNETCKRGFNGCCSPSACRRGENLIQRQLFKGIVRLRLTDYRTIWANKGEAAENDMNFFGMFLFSTGKITSSSCPM